MACPWLPRELSHHPPPYPAEAVAAGPFHHTPPAKMSTNTIAVMPQGPDTLQLLQHRIKVYWLLPYIHMRIAGDPVPAQNGTVL